MDEVELSIARGRGETLSAWFSPERRSGAVRQQRFELSSGGDLVTGRYWLPHGAARALVLAVHELGRGKDDDALARAATVWAARGAATVAVDLPLHGERFNAKLSPRAIAAATGGADAVLWRGLVAQAVRDLARTLDVIAARDALPTVTCLALGSATAPIALALASLDARVAHAAAVGAPTPIALPLGPHAPKPLVWLARPDDWAPEG